MVGAFSELFQPLTIGPHLARNRVMRAATSTKLAEENAVSERLLAHYRTVANGGAGTVVTEALRFHPSAVKSPGGIAVFDPAAVAGLSRLSEVVQGAGALLIGQLNHSGRQHTSTKIPGGLIGPSPIACPRSGGVPHAMTGGEIEEFITYFGIAAGNLAQAGFDGVEIHCAQGHLLQQFLSPFSNQRDDTYGGTEVRRARFPTDVARRVRETVGADVAVGLRLGVDEFTEGGLTIEMAIAFAASLVSEGLVDYLSLSQGNFNTIDTHLPDRHYPHGPYIEHQATLKREVSGIPVVACTRIVTPQQANDIVASGLADAVALSRALIVDPEWPKKASNNLTSSIRLCIGCNECWDGLHEGTARISCVQNATAGREHELGPLEPADSPKSIVVAGGGPAGLEAARVAALRGHDVTLFEKREELGGKLLPGAQLGQHTDLFNVIRYLGPAALDAGVKIRTGAEVTPDTLELLDTEVVIVATGAAPIPGSLPGDGSIANHGGLPDLPSEMAGRKVVVVDEDGYYWAAQIAEELIDRGAKVVVVTRFFEPFRELPSVSRIAALRRLDGGGTEFMPVHSVVRAESSDLHVQHFESRRPSVLPGVSDVVWVGPQQVDDSLTSALRDAGSYSVRVIGDARAPRRIKNAIYEGNATGREI